MAMRLLWLLCCISLALTRPSLAGPCDKVDEYVKTVELVKLHLGVQFEWPFGLENADSYKAVVCVMTLMNANASSRDQRWIKSVLHFKDLPDQGRKAIVTMEVSDVKKGSRLMTVRVDVDQHRMEVLSEHTDKLSCRRELSVKSEISNGSHSIDELLSLCTKVDCQRDSLDACERGTVKIDPWMKHVLAYQRHLALDRPLNFVQFLGSHNSFNNHADGYGNGDFLLNKILHAISFDTWNFVWAQQWFTMTDQLNMGVRHLMLDPVYFMGEMRLCHAGDTISVVDKIIQFLDKVLHITIQFDSEDLGCLPHDRTFGSGLAEICEWMQQSENKNEFVMVYINDEGHTADWNHTDLIWNASVTACPDILFTPSDKERLFPDSWPTQRQLISKGMRLMLTGTGVVQNKDIFPQPTVPQWDKDTIKYFTAFPKCGNFTANEWYLVGGESQVVGPIYNGPEQEGLLTPNNIPFVLECDVSVTEMDLVSPDLIRSAMWSFNVPPPSNSCVAIGSSHLGQWVGLPCQSTYNFACVNQTNPQDWIVTEEKGMFKDGHKTCGAEGRLFAGPVDGFENSIIYHIMLTHDVSQPVWINSPVIYNNTNISVEKVQTAL